MAKQCGEKKIIGTIQNVTFYKMGDEYYARMKSSLTGKRFWKDAAFAGSRRSSERFAFGNKLASEVYRLLPEVKRCYTLYCTLKSVAIRLLKEGKHKEEVLEQLIVELRRGERVNRKAPVRRKRPIQRRRKLAVLPKVRSVEWQIRQGMKRAERREKPPTSRKGELRKIHGSIVCSSRVLKREGIVDGRVM